MSLRSFTSVRVVFFVLAGGPAVPAEEETIVTIRLGGEEAGAESFSAAPAPGGGFRDRARVDYETPTGLQVSAEATLMLREDEERLRPASFRLASRAGDDEVACDLAFDGDAVRGTLRRRGKERTVDRKLPPGAVLLDETVLHYYRTLYRRYDFAKGGAQTVPVYFASADAVFEAKLEGRGPVRVRRDGRAEKLERIAVTMGDLAVDLYGTREGRLLVLACPDRMLQAGMPGYGEAEVGD